VRALLQLLEQGYAHLVLDPKPSDLFRYRLNDVARLVLDLHLGVFPGVVR